ncbi:hypothetical protein TeGR_g12789 [Tetraparma gracilis]|uniref:Guanylate cyclase domain-containing protein n=1 Tax=Tetraparma gracilis TaxID=2962635 RepID=A0ABQ6NDB3_9STRA|nr:hypothetical protein TeGR_g12789 [Tetraparma gracilis]
MLLEYFVVSFIVLFGEPICTVAKADIYVTSFISVAAAFFIVLEVVFRLLCDSDYLSKNRIVLFNTIWIPTLSYELLFDCMSLVSLFPGTITTLNNLPKRTRINVQSNQRPSWVFLQSYSQVLFRVFAVCLRTARLERLMRSHVGSNEHVSQWQFWAAFFSAPFKSLDLWRAPPADDHDLLLAPESPTVLPDAPASESASVSSSIPPPVGESEDSFDSSSLPPPLFPSDDPSRESSRFGIGRRSIINTSPRPPASDKATAAIAGASSYPSRVAGATTSAVDFLSAARHTGNKRSLTTITRNTILQRTALFNIIVVLITVITWFRYMTFTQELAAAILIFNADYNIVLQGQSAVIFALNMKQVFQLTQFFTMESTNLLAYQGICGVWTVVSDNYEVLNATFVSPLVGPALKSGFSNPFDISRNILQVNISMPVVNSNISPNGGLFCNNTQPPFLLTGNLTSLAFFEVYDTISLPLAMLQLFEVLVVAVVWFSAVMLQTDPMSTVGLEYFRENGSDACGLSLARGCCWNDDVIEGIETTALIQALLRMTQLLRVALGPTGASFVKAIVADDDDADEDGGEQARVAKLHQNYRAQSERTLVAVTKVIISLYLNDMFSQCSDEMVNRLDRAGLQKVTLGFGLHAGNAIQGAIGSPLKVDVAFVSKSVEYSEVLESSTKDYGVRVLMSAKFRSLLSPKSRHRTRQADSRALNDAFESDTYTWDVDLAALVSHTSQSFAHSAPSNSQTDYDFDIAIWQQDHALVMVRRKYVSEFFLEWKSTFSKYLAARGEGGGAEATREAVDALTAYDLKWNDALSQKLLGKVVE